MVVTIGLVLVINFATEGRQKRFIKNAFKHFLSPAVIEQLIVNPERLKLGGERRVLSIFFSDLQDFTSISENLDPETLIGLLNDYLTAMTNIIHERLYRLGFDEEAGNFQEDNFGKGGLGADSVYAGSGRGTHQNGQSGSQWYGSVGRNGY